LSANDPKRPFPLADLLRPQKIEPASKKNGEFL
jgi:hypothetical protein